MRNTAFVVLLFSLLGSASCLDRSSDIPVAHEEIGDEQSVAVNINTADAAELQRIPNIGENLAAEIIEFRRQHGPFRRPEHLLFINGISDRRFREIRRLIRVK